ncbi:MAG: hypothetical protein IJ041_04685 [Clostridia bacterium]|nr:hypothetical protein [Clostridia bacterium]
MEKLKRILRILCLPDWLAALVVFPSFAFVIHQLATGQTEGWPAYLSYGLSAFALVLVCVRIPGIIRAFRTDFAAHPRLLRAMNAPEVRRYRTDAAYRGRIGLYLSLGLNLFNTAFQAVMGLSQHSLWFGALACYYLLLTLMRGFLARCAWKYGTGEQLRREWQRHLLCGVILLLMSLALGTVVALVVRRGDGFRYPGLTVYVMAVYAFYAIIHGVWSIPGLMCRQSPVLTASGIVRLVAALVSVLSLETALLDQFGQDSGPAFHRLMTGLTGGVICLLVLAAAVWMIVTAMEALKKEKQGAAV